MTPHGIFIPLHYGPSNVAWTNWTVAQRTFLQYHSHFQQHTAPIEDILKIPTHVLAARMESTKQQSSHIALHYCPYCQTQHRVREQSRSEWSSVTPRVTHFIQQELLLRKFVARRAAKIAGRPWQIARTGPSLSGSPSTLCRTTQDVTLIRHHST